MVLNVHRVYSPTLNSIILLLALCTLSGNECTSPLSAAFFFFFHLFSFAHFFHCYDPLDPNGNISVTFDILERTTDNGYLARVTLENYYQYRHVEKPGWKLGWTWANNEVIWSMSGAIATDRGNCSSYSGSQMPHSCKKDPTIVDLSLDVSQNRSEHCCRGGLLSAWSIDPFNAFSSFELEVRNVGDNNPLGQAPNNLTLMAPGPGYTCSPLLDTDLSVSSDFGGLRQVPVLRTWKSTCAYSSFIANTIPVCCVSLSSFYNPAITSCRNCSCGCREADKSTASCIRPSSLPRSNGDNTIDEIIECTDHMCPVRVHWHFKNNYMNQWRVKLTVSNYNYNRNYSNWNVLVQHPGFTQKARTYSFNSTRLPTLGLQDGVSLFWGIDYYNNELVHSDKGVVGLVTTEILLDKDPNSFTVSNGWAFPRRIYFNGENCEMPLPDTFPMLPNGSSSLRATYCAMQTEALPIVNRFQLTEDPHSPFPQGAPWVHYHGTFKDLNINLIWTGNDPTLGVDSIGTIPSALATYAAILALQPDLIINAGTAGGFKAKGASIGDIFVVSECAFHDRRIPIPVFDLYGVGVRKTFEAPNLVKELNLKVGKLSTGDSLDMTQQDESSIIANDATVKDMEGAAIAYVSDLLKVPAMFVKAVTDIIDGDKPTAEEFLQNLAAVTAALDLAVEQVINFINGKCVSEL
ncbi:COBRA-like protein 2 [Glycine max]|nr:COBRA-like protein 2 [Glycine max]